MSIRPQFLVCKVIAVILSHISKYYTKSVIIVLPNNE